LDECLTRTHLRPWYSNSEGVKEGAITLSCDEDENERVGCKDIIAIKLAANNRIAEGKKKEDNFAITGISPHSLIIT
jgi:hypothetical protein